MKGSEIFDLIMRLKDNPTDEALLTALGELIVRQGLVTTPADREREHLTRDNRELRKEKKDLKRRLSMAKAHQGILEKDNKRLKEEVKRLREQLLEEEDKKPVGLVDPTSSYPGYQLPFPYEPIWYDGSHMTNLPTGANPDINSWFYPKPQKRKKAK